MDPKEFSDETLMAYADGELDAVTAEAVAVRVAADPGVARRLAVFERTRDLLAEAGRSRGLEPVTADLEARARAAFGSAATMAGKGETVVAFRPRRTGAPGYRPLAAAAALALAVGVAGGFLVSQSIGGGEPGGMSLAALDRPGVTGALDSLPSGERVAVDGGEVSAIASFLDADGAFCREFEFDRAALGTLVSVACRTDDGWQARFAVVAPGADETGYAPASSLETLDAYLGAIGAGAPLTLDDEAAALRGIGG